MVLERCARVLNATIDEQGVYARVHTITLCLVVLNEGGQSGLSLLSAVKQSCQCRI